MDTQFVTNNKGEKTAVIIPINEYEDLLHQQHLNLDLTDDYKKMIDAMINEEAGGKAEYISYADIKKRFQPK